MTVKTPDFDTLRQSGLELIQKLAPTTWTDHNNADPGITLLDQICYALLDLGYRVDFSIEDLLAGGSDAAYELLFSPRKALSSQPVVPEDYRRMLIDVEGIQNAHVSTNTASSPVLYYAPFSEELVLADYRSELLPNEVYRPVQLKGLVDVNIQKTPEANETDVEPLAYQQVLASRGLATDLENMTVLPEEKVKIRVALELGTAQDVEALTARVLHLLYQYVNPSFSFQPLNAFRQERLIEEVFDGPAMANGFLSKEQLRKFEKRAELRRSDLVQVLMNLAPEIKTILTLDIAKEGEEFSSHRLDWLVPLDANKAVVFDKEDYEISFFRDDLPVTYDSDEVEEKYQELWQQAQSTPPEAKDLDYLPARGTNQEVAYYTSVRHHMPEVYGVTPYGLPENAPNARRAQARQLSAYLLFFEQILADHFAQLGSVPTLLSAARDQGDFQSYFAQTLNADNVPALEGIYSQGEAPNTQSNAIEVLGNATDKSRSSRFLDHFLARFSESFSDNILTQSGNSGAFGNAIEAKRAFVKNSPQLSAARGTAFDYSSTEWNVSGTQKRIAQLLGLSTPEQQNLAMGLEGFYIVEHILLRPRSGDVFQNGPLLAFLPNEDPYSLQVTYVFHEVGRFASDQKNTRRFTERLLRLETPAHIRIKTYWLTTSKMAVFESAYQKFLTELAALKTQSNVQAHALRVNRDYLLDVLYMYHPQYPNPTNWGVAVPVRDLPLETLAPTYNSETDRWKVTIRLYYPQTNVTYRICDRNRRPVAGLTPITIEADTIRQEDYEQRPYVLMSSPAITQDQIYWIRAEKKLTMTNAEGEPKSKTLKSVFLTQPVRARVGVGLVNAQAAAAEIDYGTQATIDLSGIQANVDYALYIDNTRIDDGGTYNGQENGTLSITTQVTDGLKEDVLIIVKGTRDGATAEVGSVQLRVRAYPGLSIALSQQVVDHGVTTGVNAVISDGTFATQASVDYHLYYREISDPEFVHHKLSQPPATDVLEVDNGEGTTVKILRPAVPATTNNAPERYEAAPISAIDYQLLATLSPAADGDDLVFDLSALNTTQDTMFMVVASKAGHTQPTILSSNDRTTIGALFTRPMTTATHVINPNPVVNNTKARLEVANMQAGMLYYLEYTNGAKQAPKLYHDAQTASPRRDGVGFSKVGVDMAPGEATPTTFFVETNNPITDDKTLRLVAEKPQTGVSVIIASIDFTVSS
ncbi:hypothetical protein [Microscilla marina]|uniref:Uncharacterized protein n=1 Tax=Microscilla marina ATCC 23134 TaxID=313606 RepID=A1ZC18_MICM2|nr:hypothetical protein [Microscilla marina]EAY31820.1 conserved hypothetical protein [Microscilla marina ATCC 23134]